MRHDVTQVDPTRSHQCQERLPRVPDTPSVHAFENNVFHVYVIGDLDGDRAGVANGDDQAVAPNALEQRAKHHVGPRRLEGDVHTAAAWHYTATERRNIDV